MRQLHWNWVMCVARARFVDVWAKRNGQWQVIFTQIHEAP